ncbi:hypothetical protein SAMN05428997_1488 [Bosea sp. CRIB-10]|uniref:hypothetical protein n=1 Tax=Bosea sp. CRIB-10 TaxID=378404 RepID=UPI0008EDFDEA|nr:hypothetical protein [Bosea sp. CRIB-10]SFD74132.1 hypothetical protein SAMN05428997_1488 [Bosea sp. CRIB-10]
MKRTAPTAALPRGPLHYWKEMVAMSRGSGFTITDVHKATNGRSRNTVKTYVLFCAEHGHIALVGDQPTVKNRRANIYKVCDLRAPAPVQRRADFADDRGRRAQQLWTAIRALRQFTIRELAVAASTDAVPVTQVRAREYVGVLAKAGYVVEVGQRAHPGLIARWRLMPAKNTGPKAPATLAGGTVLYDRNLDEAVNLNAPETTGRAA